MLITYKPGNVHLNADFFSRLKHQDEGPLIVGILEDMADELSDKEITAMVQEEMMKSVGTSINEVATICWGTETEEDEIFI